MTSAPTDPRTYSIAVAIAGWAVITAACLWRARRSPYPSILWTCSAYMTVLHGVWIAGLLTSRMFSSGFGTLTLLTFPWSMAVMFNMTMAGFRTAPDLLLNYVRFVLGFGGLQCLLLAAFIWQLRPRPRRMRL